ncbi:putative leucine-rich repeat-containing protein DDB_G0290503 [Microplitis mediator]|uniref:putative leucine-rich repeat-containing protein DDB_G0290503 n=1 Tax=Microplitis mediator TaxID=375433 RepID=UPI002553384A|nr:putative leucine-rich repeat-containing protein DDB_G0290503 [Microplitis mediator]
MEVILNDFPVKKNKNGDYCLKNIYKHTKLPYNSFYREFKKKKYITRGELNYFFRKYKDRGKVDDFEEKLNLFEENKWIKKVAVIIKDNNFDLQIDKLFIKVWTAFESQVGKYIISFLILKSMEFDSKFNFDKQLSKFVKLLETNKVGDKTIRNFKSCIKSLNKCSAKKVKKYYTNFGKIFDCYKNNIAKLEKQKLRNDNQELREQLNEIETQFHKKKTHFNEKKTQLNEIETQLNEKITQLNEIKTQLNEIKTQLNEKETQLNEKDTQLNELIHINSSNGIVLDDIKMPNQDGYIYIATTIQYARQNIFKIGFTVDLNRRLSGLNTGKISTDRLYYSYYKKTFNVRKIEQMIHNLLVDYRDSSKNEFFKLHYTCLSEIVKFVINNSNKPDEYFTDFVENKVKEAYNLRPIVPPKMPIPDYNGLSESEIVNTLTKIIIHYGDCEVYEIKRTKLVSDLQKELRSKLPSRVVWNLFKTHFNWQSKNTPIYCGDHETTVVY